MRQFTQYNDPVRILGRRAWTLLLLAGCTFVWVGVWKALDKQAESYDMRIKAEADLSDAQARKDKLQETIDGLASVRGTEAALRERYGLGKDGEELVVIVESDAQIIQRATSTKWERVKQKLKFW